MLPWKKTRTRLGHWIDKNKVTQEWLVKATGFDRNTISALCGDIEYNPRNTTRTKIIKALRQIDPNVSASEFW